MRLRVALGLFACEGKEALQTPWSSAFRVTRCSRCRLAALQSAARWTTMLSWRYVLNPLRFQRVLMAVHILNDIPWQATQEACAPVQPLQLLRPDLYPDIDDAALAAPAQSRVLVFVKKILSLAKRSRSKEASIRPKKQEALKRQQESAALRRNLAVGAAGHRGDFRRLHAKSSILVHIRLLMCQTSSFGP